MTYTTVEPPGRIRTGAITYFCGNRVCSRFFNLLLPIVSHPNLKDWEFLDLPQCFRL
jgi:hypothetical protein